MTKQFIVITSIHNPSESIKKFSKIEGWEVIVVADLKTPKDWKQDNVILLTVDEQKKLPFKTVDFLPWNHYARKNIGYLYAIMQGAELLYETDDDNIPYEFWPSFYPVELTAEVPLQEESFINTYSYFCDANIWPRGFPLEAIRDSKIKETVSKRVSAPIQQGLANLDPDVDAIYRLVLGEQINFSNCSPLFVGSGNYCPFNSQNTLWYPEAFPYLFLPAFVPSRVTDIWRGYIAQRVLHLKNQGILFCNASVFQDRNTHNLMTDFHEEIELYTKSVNLIKALQEYAGNFGDIIEHLSLHKFFDEREVALFNAWLQDIQFLGLSPL
jgi:hypothetical protein